MKTKIISLAILSILTLLSCSNSSDENKARQNIEKFLQDDLNEGVTITSKEFSKLYILIPGSLDNAPRVDSTKTMEEQNKVVVKLMGLLDGGLMLSLHGCTPNDFREIIEKDAKFREWETGAREFVMLSYFDVYMN